MTLYAAASVDAKPVQVKIDRLSGAVTNAASGAAIQGAVVKKNQAGDTLEIKLPLAELGLDKAKAFCLNLARTTSGTPGKNTTAYWRGHEFSVANPMVYDRFVVK